MQDQDIIPCFGAEAVARITMAQKGSKSRKPPPPPPPPARETATQAAQASKIQKRRRNAQGIQATILTGDMGGASPSAAQIPPTAISGARAGLLARTFGVRS